MTEPAGLFARRTAPGLALADSADAVARAGHAMAARFHRGGTLFAFGSGAAATDAQHIAVEFVHPVVVGTRALPALALTNDVAFAHQLRQLAGPHDIALGVAADGAAPSVVEGLEEATRLGLLTVGLSGGSALPAEHGIVVASDDPLVVKEVHVTAYHVLWELVHVFLDHPGVLTS